MFLPHLSSPPTYHLQIEMTPQILSLQTSSLEPGHLGSLPGMADIRRPVKNYDGPTPPALSTRAGRLHPSSLLQPCLGIPTVPAMLWLVLFFVRPEPSHALVLQSLATGRLTNVDVFMTLCLCACHCSGQCPPRFLRHHLSLA